MEMPWCTKPAAILLMYLSGCRGGHATVDILLGRANPSGKLAETWPERLQDTALGRSFPDIDREVLYRESIYVGYRYFDAAGITPAYPFGFGRSYTSFSYSDPVVRFVEDGVEASCTVTNTGVRAGAETVQLYIEPRGREAFGEVRRLVAFKKTRLAPGESARVIMRIDERAFRFWDVREHRWRIDEGNYSVLFCASSRDVRLTCNIALSAGDGSRSFRVEPALRLRSFERQALAPYYEVVSGGFSDEAFTALYGGPLPMRRPIKPFTPDSPVSDLATTLLGRQAFRVIDFLMAGKTKRMNDDMKAMMNEVAADMPLRSFTSVGIPFSVVEGLVDVLNGHWAKGVAHVLKTSR